MQVFCLCSLAELAPYADDWDRLSGGVPFRSWAWLSAWWRHYGEEYGEKGRRRLSVVCVFDDTDTLIGLAPWYLDCRGPQGRVLRMLGSGKVCSDYLGVLCQAAMQYRVTEAVADYVTGNIRAEGCAANRWDLMEISGVDAEDGGIAQLAGHLAGRGNTVHRRAGPNCWRIELPPTWHDYLAMLSKGHRKQLRRLERNVLAAGRAVLHTVQQMADLPRAVDLLIDLHQRRHRALGQPGCFASARFTNFHREVMPELLRAGQLQLHWLELDGRAAAAEYHVAAGGVVYAYQSGVDPEALQEQPGQLITLATVRRAIEQGYRAFDFLRGDEPYKSHWRAHPRPSLTLRVVPNRTSARWRHNLWMAGSNARQWLRRGLKPVATRGNVGDGDRQP